MDTLASYSVTHNDASLIAMEVAAAREVLERGDRRAADYLESSVAEFIGINYATAIELGSMTGFVLCEALGLGPKDHVVLHPFIPQYVVKALAMFGVSATVCDTETLSPNFDLAMLPKAASRRTKAIFAPHVGGFLSPMDDILDIAVDRGAIVVEIPGAAFGARYRDYKVGALGHVSLIDFTASPFFMGLRGGLIATSVDTLAGRIRQVTGSYTARMTALNASIAGVRMDALSSMQSRFGMLADRYTRDLTGSPWVQIPPKDRTFGCFCPRVDMEGGKSTRADVIGVIRDAGFLPGYLPEPITSDPTMRKAFKLKDDAAVNAARWYHRAVPLPLDPSMGEGDAAAVARAMREKLGG